MDLTTVKRTMCRVGLLVVLVFSAASAHPSPLRAPVSECPPDTPDGARVFIASNESCTDFYMCSHGVPYKLTCPGELYFNVVTGQCDYRQNVNCTVPSAPTRSPDSTTSKPAPTGLQRLVLAELELEELQRCPETDGPYPVMFPNPDDCSSYFMCSHGVEKLRPCPPGLFFNNDTWTCDFSWRELRDK
ncbi:peritrophin-1-like [Pollicipes pollicipes]|uniref:peritrophin-1-like n=1 Tax=Pollicipes pollicipes TaxID=41117 RepID=UPI001884B9C7|nr:peritrophin-1-like [Pollicipes pollicipes]